MIMADKQYNPMLQQQLISYIKEVGGQAKAAKRIGYCDSVLSQYKKGIYTGDIPTLEARLQEIFAVKEAAENYLPVNSGYVPTSTSEAIYNTIRLCHLKGMFAIECGDAGVGKTKAAKKYLRDYPASAIYVCINPCNSGVKAFLKKLCAQLQLPISSKEEMDQALYNYFNREKKVLIVDESQHLPLKTLETIRGWLEEDNPMLGVVLMGNQDILNKRGGVNRALYLQLDNRTWFTNIRHTTHTTFHDIELLFPALVEHEKELQLLHVIAQSEKGPRGAMYVYSNACGQNDTSYEGLLAMAKYMKTIAGGF